MVYFNALNIGIISFETLLGSIVNIGCSSNGTFNSSNISKMKNNLKQTLKTHFNLFNHKSSHITHKGGSINEPKTESKSKPESEPNLESKTKTESKSKSESETKTESEPNSESKTKTKTENKPKKIGGTKSPTQLFQTCCNEQLFNIITSVLTDLIDNPDTEKLLNTFKLTKPIKAVIKAIDPNNKTKHEEDIKNFKNAWGILKLTENNIIGIIGIFFKTILCNFFSLSNVTNELFLRMGNPMDIVDTICSGSVAGIFVLFPYIISIIILIFIELF